MSNWNKITNPLTGRKVSIKSILGKNIINNFIKQSGGSAKIDISEEFNNVGFTKLASSIECEDFKTCCLPYLKPFIEELGSSARGIENLKMIMNIEDNDIRIRSNKAFQINDLHHLRVPSWIEFGQSFDNYPILKTYYGQIKVIQLCVKHFPEESNNIINSKNLLSIQGYPKGLPYKYTDSESNNLTDFLNYYQELLDEILQHTPQQITNMLNSYSESSYKELLGQKNNLGWKYFINQLRLYYLYHKSEKIYIFRDNKILVLN